MTIIIISFCILLIIVIYITYKITKYQILYSNTKYGIIPYDIIWNKKSDFIDINIIIDVKILKETDNKAFIEILSLSSDNTQYNKEYYSSYKEKKNKIDLMYNAIGRWVDYTDIKLYQDPNSRKNKLRFVLESFE